MPTPKLCVCGHARDAHEHYRRGSDCAICGAEVCPRYRASRGSVSDPANGPDSGAPQRSPGDAATAGSGPV